MDSAAFEAAFEKLMPVGQEVQSIAPVAISAGDPLPPQRSAPADTAVDAKRFLLQVMHDTTVALALRIDAAKALLRHASDRR